MKNTVWYTLDSKYPRSAKEKGKIDPMYEELKKAKFPILENLCRRGRTCARESVTKQLQDTLLPAIVPPDRTSRSQSSAPPIATTSIPSHFDVFLFIGEIFPLCVTF